MTPGWWPLVTKRSAFALTQAVEADWKRRERALLGVIEATKSDKNGLHQKCIDLQEAAVRNEDLIAQLRSELEKRVAR